VLAGQRPPGEIVVELVGRAPRPPHQLGLAADVLDVAVLAGLPLVLLAVEAGAGVEARAQILVTRQAPAGDHLLARLVALVAVVVAVDAGVGRRQRPRRQELRLGAAGGDRDQRAHDEGEQQAEHQKIQR
jgi:hypothetical protein